MPATDLDATDGTSSRLFVAVVPPPEAVAHLRTTVTAAMPHGDGLRRTPVAQWHLTLAFLPAVPADDVAAVVAAVGDATAAHGPFTLRLAGSGRFGDRVVWVGADAGTESGTESGTAALAAVAASVRAAFVATGTHVDDRPFRAHLTLARGSDRDRRAVRAAVERLAAYEGPTWTVDELRLVRSYPGERGARHEVVARHPLGRA